MIINTYEPFIDCLGEALIACKASDYINLNEIVQYSISLESSIFTVQGETNIRIPHIPLIIV